MIRQLDGGQRPKRVSRLHVIGNLLIVIFVCIEVVFHLLVLSNYKYLVFSVRRPDIQSAAMKVEAEEQKQIQAKIEEARKITLKKILSPIVVSSNVK